MDETTWTECLCDLGSLNCKMSLKSKCHFFINNLIKESNLFMKKKYVKYKERLIVSATNYARKIMNIDEFLWVFINDGNIFKSVNHSGLYDKANFIIRFNREWLKIAEFKNIVETSFHEVFHVVQHQALIEREYNIESKLFTEEELDQLAKEFRDENYNDSSDAWGLNMAEQQAEAFAKHLYNEFIKRVKNIDDFIKEYYIMFPNQE